MLTGLCVNMIFLKCIWLHEDPFFIIRLVWFEVLINELGICVMLCLP